MIKPQRKHLISLLLFIALGCLGCSTDEDIISVVSSSPAQPDDGIVKNAYNDSLGRVNAVKKARQMTDLEFTPLKPILQRNGTFEPGIKYKGIIYSSVTELSTFVGEEVSFHTYMTALHNPKSKLYTVDISKPPYHSTNGRAYYGTVCSTFVSYALGLYPRYFANDFPLLDFMEEVDLTNLDTIEVADVLWKKGHVAMITDVVRDDAGQMLEIEISESAGKGCKRYYRSRAKFANLLSSTYKKVLRYKELYKNTQYTPLPQFVAVLDEEPLSFQYNDDLCVDKGDKSCYLESEEVVVNVMHPYDYMEVYKDNELYMIVDGDTEDVRLSYLPYGDYKARISFNGQYSDYTYWKTVNVDVRADKVAGKIYFGSKNATPQYVKSLNIGGFSPNYPTRYYGCYILTDKDVTRGFIDIDKLNMLPKYPYIRVYFSTEYGTIINTPINWNEL